MKNDLFSLGALATGSISSFNTRLFEAIPGNNLLISADSPTFTIISATAEYLRVTGKTRKELIGKGTFQAFPPNPGDPADTGERILRASLEELMSSKKQQVLPVQRYDVPDRNGNFTPRFWIITNTPLLDEEGNVQYIINSAEEVTQELKSNEREAEISEIQHSHNILMQAPVAIAIIKGPEYIIELANSFITDIWGKGNDVIGKSLFEVLPELLNQGFITIIDEVLDTGKPHHAYQMPVTLFRHGRDEVMYFNFVYQPYYEEGNKKPIGFIIISIDVTEKVLAETSLAESEQSLHDSEQRFRMMADNIPNLAWMADETGAIFWYNQQWYQYTGTTEDEMKGWGWQSVHNPENLPQVLLQWRESIYTGEPFEMVFPLKGADGLFRQFLTRVLPVRDSEGRIQKWFGTNTDITNQIRTEQSLSESEQRFRNLADESPIFVYIVEPSTEARMSYWNKTWLEYTGQSLVQALGTAWDGIIHPDDVADVMKIYVPAFEERTPYLIPAARVRRLDGIYRWHAFKGTPRFLSSGDFNGYVGVGFDIHHQKMAEEALNESVQKFRSLMEETPVATALFVGRELVIELVNDIMIGYMGKDRSVVGKRYRDAMPELEGQGFFELMDNVFTSGMSYNDKQAPVSFLMDGKFQTRYFNYTYTPLFKTDGNVYAIMLTAMEVTEQVLAKNAVEKSEQNLRNVILQSPVAMCILKGPEFIVEIANERMLELWGRTKEELMNRSIFEGVPEAKGQGYEALLHGVYTTGVTYSAQGVPVMLPRNDKVETVYINLVYEAFRDGTGTITGIMVVAFDVTVQVLANQKIEEVVAQRTRELGEANTALKNNNQELEQFAYIASHDLQEPLRKVNTFTEMLKDHLGVLDERSLNYFDKISGSMHRMRQLISDILDYSQLSNKQEVFSQVDLNKLVPAIEADFELIIEQKGARLIYTDLPVITANTLQMQQLFGNLLSNALKFTKEAVSPIITVSGRKLTDLEKRKYHQLSPDIDYCIITVTDNGIGFSDQYAEKIFSIFQRLHGRTEYAGTGIGLALCKKIAQNHRGLIWATSNKDEGSTFHIILPEKGMAKKLLG